MGNVRKFYRVGFSLLLKLKINKTRGTTKYTNESQKCRG
jgi:hypothetical protein